jgi:hypothetical protein
MRFVYVPLTLWSILAGNLSGCVWVDLNPKGESVKVLTQSEASKCSRIGHVESTTAADVIGIPRDDESINNELTRLARNHAGEMGGNAVLAVGQVQNGTQTFNVFRCSKALSR